MSNEQKKPTVWVSTPVSMKPEKRDRYFVITTDGVMTDREYYPDDDDWSGYADTKIWLRPVEVEVPSEEEIDKHFSNANEKYWDISKKEVAQISAEWMRDRCAAALAVKEAVIRSKLEGILQGLLNDYDQNKHKMTKEDYDNRRSVTVHCLHLIKTGK